ncbi:MAG TPA: hypothetical protein VIN09_12970 [Chloroflexota bacterium]
MTGVERYIAWINDNIGFNPRAQQASNALSQFVIDDLRQACPTLSHDLDEEQLRTAPVPRELEGQGSERGNSEPRNLQ